MSRLSPWLLVATLVVMPSCGLGEAIRDLGDYAIDVDPENLCECGQVTVRWTAERGGRLEAEPEVDPPITGEIEGSGEADVTVCQPTSFRLTKTIRGESLEREANANVVPVDGQTFTIIGSPVCNEDGTFAGWQTATVPEAGPNIRVRGVLNTNDRQISIGHSGTERTVGSGELVPYWNGTAFAGTWTIDADLIDGPGAYESCDCGGRTAPDPRTCTAPPPLSLHVEVGCA